MADVNSGLTFTNHGDPVDTLTVKETVNGNTVATSQTITVTDPPVSPPTSTTTPNATVIPVAQDADCDENGGESEKRHFGHGR